MKGRLIWGMLAAVFLVGCGTAPPDMSVTPSHAYEVPAAKIVVDDFMQDAKYSATDAVWSNQFHPLPDASTRPDFPELVLHRVKTQLSAGTPSGDDVLNVSLLRAAILQKARLADSVPFVGLASALSPRDFLCVVDANFKHDDFSVRQEFIYSDTLPRAWGDAEVPVKKAFVDECLDSILTQMQDFSTKLARR